MARPRRVQAQALQDALRVRPVAAPVDLFAQPYVGAPQGPNPLQAFAALSSTLGHYVEEHEKKRAEEGQLEGERFVQENPQLVQKYEADIAAVKDDKERAKRAVADLEFLQRNGAIPAAANPNWRIGYMRAAGRLMSSIYQQQVMARINEVSTVRNEDGEPLLPVLPEAVLAEEWEKVANSPAVQSFYGGQEALRVKQDVDEGFRIEAAKRRAVALENAHNDNLGREIGRMFDQALVENDVVTTESLKPITAYLANEVRGHSVLNPRELTFAALQLTFQKLAATDPEAAVRAVHAAEELQVAGVKLGEDRGPVGTRLQELKRQYQEDARQAVRRDVQDEATRRERAVQEAEKDYIPRLVEAKRLGIPVQQVVRQLSDRYLKEDAQDDRYGGYGAFVVEQLEAHAQNLDNARQSDQLTVDQVQALMAQGRIDDAELLLKASLNSQTITGADYAKLQTNLQSRRQISPLVEGDAMYQAVSGRYERLKPTGFAPDVQQRVDERSLELQTRFSQDFAAYAATTRELPDGEERRRNWLEERWRNDQGEYRKIEQETRGNRDVALKDVRARLDRSQDAGALIDAGERAGTFTINEAAELRQQNIQAAAGRERLLQIDAIGQAEARLRDQFDLATGKQPSPEDLTVLETAVQEIRDRHAAAVDAILADPSVDPRAFTSRARSEAVRIGNEVQDELFPSLRKQAEAALKEGRGLEGEQARRAAYDENLALASSLAGIVADPARRENLSARDLAPLQAPSVPQRFYDYAAGWMSGLDPIAGAPVQRDDVVGEAITALRHVPADQRKEADASVVSVLGVDPLDVLRGKAELALPEDRRAEIQREVDFLESPVGAFLGGGASVSRLRAFKDMLEPVPLDLTGMDLRPLTTPFFRSRAAMDAFSEDPAWPEFLRRLGIAPEDEAQVQEFVDAQLDAIDRTNP